MQLDGTRIHTHTHTIGVNPSGGRRAARHTSEPGGDVVGI